jgi:hypothetical protein
MKAITADNYFITPFVTHKTQTYDYTFAGLSNPPQVSIDVATKPATSPWYWSGSNEPQNDDGLYERTLYASTKTLFDKFFTNILPAHGETPISSSGNDSYFSRPYFNAGIFFGSYFGSVFTIFPNADTFYVINIAQQTYGERINPYSFQISDSSGGIIVDDGHGNLILKNTNIILGSILYSFGIAVLVKSANPDQDQPIKGGGLKLVDATQITIEYDAVQTIYEHQILCTMDIGEFNFSTNPTLAMTSSLSDGNKPIKLYASGSMPVYMTTVGIYTDRGELVAIGKFPKPIKRAENSQQTVVIRFDA